MPSSKTLRNAFAVALCLTTCLLLLEPVATTRSRAQAQNAPDLKPNLKTFENALEIVQRNNVPPVSTRRLIDYAISGMLTSLDPHSLYLTGDTLRDRQVDIGGRYGGLGIQIMVKNRAVTVSSVMDDTPAAHAGLKSGDQIMKIDGDPVADMSFAQAKDRMRGPRGSTIELLLRRAGMADPMALTMIRDIIQIQAVKSRLLSNGYIYLQLAVFQQGSDEVIGKAIDKLRRQNGGPIKGLVLDLRDNPGGLLSQAVKISDQFLDAREIVYTQGREGEPRRFFSHHKSDSSYDYPMAVLVNGGTASASEILAGALQDNGRAVIVGTRSFGKGSVQTLIPIDDRSAVQLTTALYYTPSGCSIQAVGITPDVVVENPRAAQDPLGDDGSGAMERGTNDANDLQLRRATDVLQYWDSFKTQITRQAEHHVCRVG